MGLIFIRPENVGTAILKMIESAQAGDIWISEDDEPAYAIADPQPYKERRVLV
jgi:15-hydroxyprostaglandin dehydrogenase (NAD)